ncbi:MAG: hypothetical protein COV34_00765 [Candidatus Zambryskibacteria bacterium CG10_big_fil_rev_8_21_14_0_10_42_12]|uniref:VanZ-like domain-containing protein n=1 Tax=Candidatus Zambryskibacteria bacterium CG10_big_fil_rev_8_21_14_0_10_42_12 TaxID=1975115 RepID=A0A2H0QXQ9_9BACT|nr:MAG: hypothetical protein COV34_00765 [Candidatus Zambryskibacteria bacterium CG10_big_fil_rev_8_21_14_0_10_42_12]
MKTRTIVWYIGLTALLIGIGQQVAIAYSLYWSIWWYDIVMHFLGGLWIALIALWFYKSFAGEDAESGRGYLVALSTTVVVGILWEVMEILAGLTLTQANYEVDTVVDLIMDVIGAVVATRLVFRRVVINHHPIEEHV